MHHFSASQTRGLGPRLACLLTWLGSSTSGIPMASGSPPCKRCCSRSVHIVHVVADQEHSDHVVSRYRYRTELVWRFFCANCASANHWIVLLTLSTSWRFFKSP